MIALRHIYQPPVAPKHKPKKKPFPVHNFHLVEPVAPKPKKPRKKVYLTCPNCRHKHLGRIVGHYCSPCSAVLDDPAGLARVKRDRKRNLVRRGPKGRARG